MHLVNMFGKLKWYVYFPKFLEKLFLCWFRRQETISVVLLMIDWLSSQPPPLVLGEICPESLYTKFQCEAGGTTKAGLRHLSSLSLFTRQANNWYALVGIFQLFRWHYAYLNRQLFHSAFKEVGGCFLWKYYTSSFKQSNQHNLLFQVITFKMARFSRFQLQLFPEGWQP